jgi:catechol 2,3-dioxygenase-like lactoylglutathione lyase family enzyme
MRKLTIALAGLLLLPMPAFAAEPTPPPVPEAGSLIGPVMFVTSIERSLKFYTDGLGMTLNMKMGPDARREYMIGFGADPRKPGMILLHDDTPGAPPQLAAQAHGYDRTVLRITDLDALAARLTAAGFAHGGIHDVAMGYRMMMVTDPDGYKLELVQIRPRP